MLREERANSAEIPAQTERGPGGGAPGGARGRPAAGTGVVPVGSDLPGQRGRANTGTKVRRALLNL